MDNAQCVFCKIIEGTIPSIKIYEDENTLAILDIFPAAKGHTLVLPKKHTTVLPEMEEKNGMQLMSSILRVAKAVIKASGAQGFNIIQNNHEVAGQTVPHVHFHIVPRNKDDGLQISFEKKVSYEQGEADSLGQKIKGAIQ